MAKPSTPAASALPPTGLFLAGVLAIFIGERLVGAGTYRWISALGALLVLVSIGGRALRFASAEGDRKIAERILLLLSVLGAFGLLLYAFQSDLHELAVRQAARSQLAAGSPVCWRPSGRRSSRARSCR